MLRRGLETVALVTCLVVAPHVSAQQEDWQVMWDRGVALRAEGNDLEALAVFQEAHRLGGGARALVQIALAEQALGRWGAAATHLEEALASPDEWIERNRVVIAHARAEIATHTGRLRIAVDVPGAEIEVEGRAVGTSPLDAPVLVTAGEVVVRARAPRGATAEERVSVGVGGTARVMLELELAPPPAPEPAPEPEAEREAMPVPSPEPEPPASDAFPIDPAIVAFAVAGGAGVALAVTGAMALDADAEVGERCGENAGMTCSPDDVADLRTLTTVADVMIVVTAAAALAGAVLAIVSATSGGDDDAVTVAPFLGPNVAGIVGRVALRPL